ncbi:uncharacterized protein K489DRAFT_314979 [Dissoconium aciculare CBS 342.82]|uniref:Uncharacterized protein n=1 Tax=Dissoconium aciculare CBS 342.82 TaxID=1314786 RepID=A0A6J3MBY3_9PEZI|nr:uncharacterized protein K489DRAFT_314979 [Dissoconium aciculare CBS 342.82]KAF1825531.1 hypothetical protein K489DRAFT_314979 [Dissoconium aciculare CBS 342.82]
MLKTIEPTPRTWSLRFKHGRTTVLIVVDPLQSLSDIRAELLTALQQASPSGKLNGHDIPQNPDEIKLGIPVNINDLSEGYILLERQDLDDEDAAPKGKGKGKASAASVRKPGASTLKACPQGVGMRDGGLVAFKFASEEDVAETEADDFAIVEEKWNVTVPTMEDTYENDEASIPDDEIEVPVLNR